MTASNGSSLRGALEAVRRLEGALEAGNLARAEADDALDTAREEAERLLADARAAGDVAGRRRRAEILEASEAETLAIRAAGQAKAKDLLRRVSAERDELVAELVAIVLAQEA
jgi:vacuolar-type H+-ATPase subunit H